VPMLSAGSRAYQISDVVLPVVPGGVLDQRIRAGLAQPLPGGLWALYLAESPEGNPVRLELLDAYDLRTDPARACLRISGAEHNDVAACPLIPRAAKASTAGVD